jgi:DNA-binding response OmpR family regulator
MDNDDLIRDAGPSTSALPRPSLSLRRQLSCEAILEPIDEKLMNKVVMMREVPSPIAGPAAARIVRDRELVPIVSILAKPDDLEGTLRELLRQLHCYLDSSTPSTAAESGVSDESVMEIAELRIDRAGHRVRVAGQEVILTSLEFKLLVLLIERRERVQGRGILLKEIWARSTDNRTRTVDTHVKRLRDKLRSAARFIQTVRGVGYRFSDAALTA